MPSTAKIAKKSCFVISPIGDPGSATRERADLVYDFVISAVLENEPFNFIVDRADKLGEPGLITNQIVERVIEADLVVADLSERNPNVFYELAVRHIAQKPFVHLISEGEIIPFDNAQARAISVNVNDLRSVDAAKNELARQVKATMDPASPIESPVSIAVSLMDMKKSGDNDAPILRAILSGIDTLQRSQNETRKPVHKEVDFGKYPALAEMLTPYISSRQVNTDALRAALGHTVGQLQDLNLGEASGLLESGGVKTNKSKRDDLGRKNT